MNQFWDRLMAFIGPLPRLPDIGSGHAELNYLYAWLMHYAVSASRYLSEHPIMLALPALLLGIALVPRPKRPPKQLHADLIEPHRRLPCATRWRPWAA